MVVSTGFFGSSIIIQLQKKNRRQTRWHPAMIKWRLSLKYLSSSCCNALRSSNVIQLPPERTLRDYRKPQPVLVLMLINKFLVRLTWKTVLIIIVTFALQWMSVRLKRTSYTINILGN